MRKVTGMRLPPTHDRADLCYFASADAYVTSIAINPTTNPIERDDHRHLIAENLENCKCSAILIVSICKMQTFNLSLLTGMFSWACYANTLSVLPLPHPS